MVISNAGAAVGSPQFCVGPASGLCCVGPCVEPSGKSSRSNTLAKGWSYIPYQKYPATKCALPSGGRIGLPFPTRPRSPSTEVEYALALAASLGTSG